MPQASEGENGRKQGLLLRPRGGEGWSRIIRLLSTRREQEHQPASLRKHRPIGKVGATPSSTVGKVGSALRLRSSPHSSLAEVYGYGHGSISAFWFYTRSRFHTRRISVQCRISQSEPHSSHGHRYRLYRYPTVGTTSIDAQVNRCIGNADTAHRIRTSA
jgi:hypothetical protein